MQFATQNIEPVIELVLRTIESDGMAPTGPDLNITECVWDYMKRQNNGRKTPATEDLWSVLQNVWHNLPGEFLQNLCASLPKTISAVLKAQSGHIDENKLLILPFLKVFFI